MKKQVWILVLMLLLLVKAVSAQPPFAEEQSIIFTSGFIIEHPDFNYHMAYSDIWLFFHVYNITNGVMMDNETIGCRAHLYNSSGNEVLYIEDVPTHEDHGEEFYVNSSGVPVGYYGWAIHCNQSDVFGGYSAGTFEVTIDGDIPSEETGFVMLAVIGLMVSITFLLLILAIKIKSIMLQIPLSAFTVYFISFDFFFVARLFEIIDPAQTNTINIIYTIFNMMLNISHFMLVVCTIYWLYYLWKYVLVSPTDKREDREGEDEIYG